MTTTTVFRCLVCGLWMTKFIITVAPGFRADRCDRCQEWFAVIRSIWKHLGGRGVRKYG